MNIHSRKNKFMLNYKIIAVIKKELREKLFSKSFLLMTLLIPLFMFGILGLQTFLIEYSEDDVSLIIVSENTDFLRQLDEEFDKSEYVKSGQYKITFENVQKKNTADFISGHKSELLGDKINGIVVFPSSSLEDKKVEYYSKTPNSINIFNRIKEPINKVLIDNYFIGKNITGKDLNFAREDVDFSGFKISEGSEIEKATEGNTIVAFLFTFLLYISLLMIGSMMMTSVIEEKNSRVVEILLSSLNSRDLLIGKVLGTSITSVIQMVVWLSPLILVISTTIFLIPKEYMVTISYGQVGYFLLNYLIGLITFLGLFASVGSMFENSQDAQQGMWPILILIMIPFFISLGMISNPENSIAKISSMLPFASLIVMPARMSIVDIPMWQLGISLIVSIITMIFVFIAAGKIYRIGILKTGKKPKLTEIINWLRTSS